MHRLIVTFGEEGMEAARVYADLLRGEQWVERVSIRKAERKAPDAREFLEAAMELHEKIVGAPLHVDWGKDNRLAGGLLKTYGMERLVEMWTAYLRDDDAWVKQNGVSIGGFKFHVARYVVAGAPKRRCPRCDGRGEYRRETSPRCGGKKRI